MPDTTPFFDPEKLVIDPYESGYDAADNREDRDPGQSSRRLEGYDAGYNDAMDDARKAEIYCKDCSIIVIWGQPTHELGCPSSWLNPLGGEPWEKKCAWCGDTYTPLASDHGTLQFNYCSVSCRNSES